MSAPIPWAEQVERRVLERLQTIAQSDVYLTTPVLVTRSLSPDPREYDTEAELQTGRPVIGIVRRSGSTRELDEQEARGPAHCFGVRVYVKGEMRAEDPEKLATTRGLYALEDVIVCLLSDPKLGGLVEDLDLDGAVENDDGEFEPFAIYEQPWAAINPGADDD